jgi:hypothetical protein
LKGIKTKQIDREESWFIDRYLMDEGSKPNRHDYASESEDLDEGIFDFTSFSVAI